MTTRSYTNKMLQEIDGIRKALGDLPLEQQKAAAQLIIALEIGAESKLESMDIERSNATDCDIEFFKRALVDRWLKLAKPLVIGKDEV